MKTTGQVTALGMAMTIVRGSCCMDRAARVAAGLVLVLYAGLLFISGDAQARGQTTKPDELRVTRTVRLTHPDFTYIPSHLCLIQPFSQDSKRILLYNGSTGVTEWGFLSDLAAWATKAEFLCVRHDLPKAPDQSTVRLPIWSVIPGENAILYGLNEITNYIVRIDLDAGTCTNWIHLDPNDFTKVGDQEFSYGFSDGVVTDGKRLIVCEYTDDPAKHVCEVDVTKQSAPPYYTVQSSYPAYWSPRWKDYPSIGHGHGCNSPDGTMSMTSCPGLPYGMGWTTYLNREDGSLTGISVSPAAADHVSWFYQNNYAIYGSNIDNSIFQAWPDGTYVQLLNLLLSMPFDPNDQRTHDRGDSWPFLSPDGKSILYHSDNGNPDATIGAFLAFVENANGENPVGVTYFRSNPVAVFSGNNATLSWSTVNATAVSIDQGIGTVSATGTCTVSPAATTTYTLTATGTGGPVSAQVTVEVGTDTDSLIVNGGMERGTLGVCPDNWSLISGPCLQSAADHADFSRVMEVWNDPAVPLMAKTAQALTPANAALAAGHQLTLTYWMKSPGLPGHATNSAIYSYRINGVWTNCTVHMDCDYSQNFIPGYWKKYTVNSIVIPGNINPQTDLVSISINPFNDWIGSQSACVYLDRVKLVVDDTPRSVSIDSFSVTPSTIGPGDACLMTWRMSNATSAGIDHGIGAVDANSLSAGQLTAGGVFPGPATDTTYTLTAQGLNGPVTATASVTIRCNLTMAADPDAGGTTTPAKNGTTSVLPNTAQNISATANSGYTFVRWHAVPARCATFGNINLASTTVSLTGHCTVTAEFMANGSESIVSLTTAANPPSCGVEVPAAGTYNVVSGTPITIMTGPAADDHMFDGWTAHPAGNVTFGDWRLPTTTATLTGSATVTARYAPNYLYNGSLEYPGTGFPEGWCGGGNIFFTQDLDSAHLKYSSKVVDNDTLAAGKITETLTTRLDEFRGKSVVLSAWVKGDGVTTTGGYMQVYTDLGARGSDFDTPTPTTWTQFHTLPLTIGANDSTLYVQIYPVGYPETGTGWIDDVRLVDADTICSLAVSAAPAGAGEADPEGTVSLDKAVPFSLWCAPADDGHMFDGWTTTGNVTLADACVEATTATLTGDATATAQFASNYLCNGSLENNGSGTPDGWISSGGSVALTRDTNSKHLKYSCKVVDNDTSAAGKLTQILTSRLSEFRGKQVVLSAWIKGDGSTNSNGAVHVYSDRGGPWAMLPATNPTTWTQYTTAPLVVTGEDAALYVQVYPTGYAETGGGWIDDVRLTVSDATVSLTMAASPGGGGTTNPAGTTPQIANTPVSISAAPNAGYQFLNWSASPACNAGFGNANAASTTVTLTGDCTVTANFNDVPVPAITAPSAGQMYNAPVTLTETVSNTIGSISKVQFFEGGTQIGPDLTASPYTYSWANPATGSHTIVAKATDSYSAVGTSSSVTFTVNDVPSVTLGVTPTSPATAPATLNLTATVTDSIGWPGRVDFYNNGMLIGSDTNSAGGWTYSWANAEASGTNGLSLTAKATDSYNAAGTSSAVAYTVNDSTYLKCYWKFDENTGGTAGDSSGAGNAGTITGATWQSGANAKVINCLSFNGSSNYVQKSSGSGLPAANATQTECFWFYIPTSNPTVTKTALAVSGTSVATKIGFISSGGMKFGVWKYNNTVLVSTSTLPAYNTWHFVAYVKNGSTNYLYIDNNAAITSTTATDGSTSRTVINAGRTASGSDYWPGKLDEIRIYSRALSATEIGALYNGGNPRQ